jgi:nucleotide-binding universal stress UspA family protein
MKPFEKILIATDGSENANVAAAQGLTLAKLMDAEVTAMSIVDIGSPYSNRGFRRAAVDNYPYLEEESNAAVEQVYKEGEGMGVAVKKIIRRGVPANEIIEASKDYDLIVMGTFGHTGLSHLLMGSVAEKVVRFAYCPVLVIRTHKE